MTSGPVLRAGTHYLSPHDPSYVLMRALAKEKQRECQRDLPLIRKILEHVEANTSIQGPPKLEFEIFDGYDP